MEFIETPFFLKASKWLLDDDELRRLQVTLLLYPAMGVVIPGSGGLRKLRWVSSGKGKKGGLRVIYYWVTADDQIYLLSVYKKSSQEDLSSDDIKYLRSVIEEEI
ncbi:MAG: hypothetical protein Q7K71_06960 [Candidatus Omnitrophota bacterium]|nr:hypothetical protein [Candidatus Omnitrophota bacterium]